MRGKKLRDNGFWESSRIIIPQHKEAIRTHRHGLNAREKPELDEQRVEELSAALAEAITSGYLTAVATFGTFGDEVLVGVVTKLDPIDRVIWLQAAEEKMRIRLDDIVNVGRV